MKKKNQIQQQNPQESRFKNFLSLYINAMIQGIIGLFIFGSFYYFVLVKSFNFPFYVGFPIIIILSIVVSPFLPKITIGNRIQKRYEEFLKKW